MTVEERNAIIKDNAVVKPGRRGKTLLMVQLALLVAISSLLVLISFPLVPAAAFLEYDMADVPILLAAFNFGAPAGLLVLTLAAAIQAFLMGKNGWIGFLMHMISSGTLVLVARAICPKDKVKGKRMVFGLIIASLCVVAVMIPLNFIFIPMLMFNVPIAESAGIFWVGLTGSLDLSLFSEMAVTAYQTVKGLIWVGIVPFNLLKYLFSSLLFYLVYKGLPLLMRKVR